MFCNKDTYVRIIYISPLGRESEEVSHIMTVAEAAIVAATFDAARRQGVRPDIQSVRVERLTKVV